VKIVSGEPVVVEGDDVGKVHTVTVGGHQINVQSATRSAAVCEPFDIFSSPFAFGDIVPVVVVGTKGTKRIDAKLMPPEGLQFVVVANAQPYLSKDIAIADGDQMATETAIDRTTIILTPDTDVTYFPALPTGTVHTRYWYDASSSEWSSGPVTVNGGLVQGDPTIYSFTVEKKSASEAVLRGKSDTTSGTVYGIVDTNPNRPTNEQIKNGLNAAGQPALATGSAIVSPGGG
jgi:hypothetical protein